MSVLYIIAGPNGAGKTTASKTLLPDFFGIYQFVNADEIAKGLSPFAPESVALESGRIMLARIKTLISENQNFGFETTLTTLSYRNYIGMAKEAGYIIKLIFLWLNSVTIAKERVNKRVLEGGHNIPTDVIERRYFKGIKNLPAFLELSDEWLIFDNSSGTYEWIAKKENNQQEIFNLEVWNKIK